MVFSNQVTLGLRNLQLHAVEVRLRAAARRPKAPRQRHGRVAAPFSQRRAAAGHGQDDTGRGQGDHAEADQNHGDFKKAMFGGQFFETKPEIYEKCWVYLVFTI